MDQERQNQTQGRQGKVLNSKPISIQFVSTPLDIRHALFDLTPLFDGTVRTSGTTRVELTSASADGEFLDCSIYTESDSDRARVIEYLSSRSIDVTDESGEGAAVRRNRRESQGWKPEGDPNKNRNG